MPKQIVTIDSIFPGEAKSQYFTAPGQFLKSIGINPFLPVSDSVGDRLTSGVLRPAPYESFHGANVTDNVVAIITNPKDTKIYVALANGRLISYNSDFSNETLIGTVTGSACNGAVYYNNYIYLFTTTNVSRYGPLDGSPSLTNTVWTGSTLGSQTALVNTTYPSLRGSGAMPNHVATVHADGQLYFLDYDSTSSTDTTRGRGLVHAIKTKYGSAEGDTNDGSAYNVLTLPPGYLPTCIESYGNNLVIGAIRSTNTTISQGDAALFFWDTLESSFFEYVPLPDSIVSGLKNINGVLYVFTGKTSNGTNVSNGYRVSAYLGGQSVRTLYYSNTGVTPSHYAVDAAGDMIMWGTFDQVQTTTAASPTYYAVVKSLNSKDPGAPAGVHTIMNTSATGTASDGLVTALLQVEEQSLSYPRLVVGHRDSGGAGIDRQSTTYGTSVFHSQLFNINSRFKITRIRINFGTAVGANMTITPKVFLDNFSSSSTSGLTVINNTNYSGERYVEYYPDIVGVQNFVLELTWSGTANLPVLLPIEIELEQIKY